MLSDVFENFYFIASIKNNIIIASAVPNGGASSNAIHPAIKRKITPIYSTPSRRFLFLELFFFVVSCFVSSCSIKLFIKNFQIFHLTLSISEVFEIPYTVIIISKIWAKLIKNIFLLNRD